MHAVRRYVGIISLCAVAFFACAGGCTTESKVDNPNSEQWSAKVPEATSVGAVSWRLDTIDAESALIVIRPGGLEETVAVIKVGIGDAIGRLRIDTPLDAGGHLESRNSEIVESSLSQIALARLRAASLDYLLASGSKAPTEARPASIKLHTSGGSLLGDSPTALIEAGPELLNPCSSGGRNLIESTRVALQSSVPAALLTDNAATSSLPAMRASVAPLSVDSTRGTCLLAMRESPVCALSVATSSATAGLVAFGSCELVAAACAAAVVCAPAAIAGQPVCIVSGGVAALGAWVSQVFGNHPPAGCSEDVSKQVFEARKGKLFPNDIMNIPASVPKKRTANGECEACPLPPKSTCYRCDDTSIQPVHAPCPGDHVHVYKNKYNQTPSCMCVFGADEQPPICLAHKCATEPVVSGVVPSAGGNYWKCL